MIHPERVRRLNKKDTQSRDYVLYWMQASQRARCNHALEFAARQADQLRQPLIVGFGLTPDFPRAQIRHYTFMLQGLAELRRQLSDRNILLVVRHGSPDEVAARLARRASLVVTDCGYLPIQKTWRRNLARTIDCPLFQIETDAVVPIETAADKQQYAAATLRPRIHRQLDRLLTPLKSAGPDKSSLPLGLDRLDLDNLNALLHDLNLDHAAPPVTSFTGGTSHALRLLRRFLKYALDDYDNDRKDPNKNATSHLSPYLHFGQISPLDVALAVRDADSPGKDPFLEELIVRRELALNFLHYQSRPESFRALPAWARDTLNQHAADPRPYIYSLEQLENADTHDPYWNAAQKQMRLTGKMHGYMRMYWGKKILEWTRKPQTALRFAIHLNDTYELDGRDPNGITGVMWCLGLHDRPWQQRPIFGTVRYMNDQGLLRKFDADAYVRAVAALDKNHA